MAWYCSTSRACRRRLASSARCCPRRGRLGVSGPGSLGALASAAPAAGEAAALAARRKDYYKQPAWVWLTRKGLAKTGLPYRYGEPSDALLKHYYAVNQARLFLEGRYGARLHWRPERALRPAAGRDRHEADAELTIDGGIVALEVELTQKSREALRAILAQLDRRYDSVWYLTTPHSRAAVERAVADLPSSSREKFTIRDLGLAYEHEPAPADPARADP